MSHSEKQGISSIHTYSVLLSLSLASPSLLWAYVSPFCLRRLRGSKSSGRTEEKQYVSSLHRYAVFLCLWLTSPSLLARSLYTHLMCPLFDYAGYAAARALVETKKNNVSSLHRYAVFLSLRLTSPYLLARSLYTYIICPLFHYSA
jgi:hypothetical protein